MQLWAHWLRHDADYGLPDGESVRQFHTRIVGAVRKLATAHAGKTLLIVTHGPYEYAMPSKYVLTDAPAETNGHHGH